MPIEWDKGWHRANRDYVKQRVFFVSDSKMHSALREWRDLMLAPKTIAVLFGVILILTIMVPFEIDNYFGPIGRFGYWTLIVLTTYSAGALIDTAVRAYWNGSVAKLIGINCLATGVAVTLIVTAINFVTIQYMPAWADLPIYLGSIFAIASIVAALFHVTSEPVASVSAAPPTILNRLPFEKRGTLLALSVEDHYVRIATSKGNDIVLLRLRDAMAETGTVNGMQVHRSHWVATAAIIAARRDGDRAILTLTNNDEIPASRRYLPALKKAGLLV
ncbi:MAG: hypothetical protein ACJAXK_002486 [Yoonia sp.]